MCAVHDIIFTVPLLPPPACCLGSGSSHLLQELLKGISNWSPSLSSFTLCCHPSKMLLLYLKFPRSASPPSQLLCLFKNWVNFPVALELVTVYILKKVNKHWSQNIPPPLTPHATAICNQREHSGRPQLLPLQLHGEWTGCALQITCHYSGWRAVFMPRLAPLFLRYFLLLQVRERESRHPRSHWAYLSRKTGIGETWQGRERG